jgi:hypothetical protein
MKFTSSAGTTCSQGNQEILQLLYDFLSGANLLANFGVAVTYETFITLGLILAVPACAGNSPFYHICTV